MAGCAVAFLLAWLILEQPGIAGAKAISVA
jgi:hypothetical protein